MSNPSMLWQKPLHLDATLAPNLLAAQRAVEQAGTNKEISKAHIGDFEGAQAFLAKLRECIIYGCEPQQREFVKSLDSQLEPLLSYALNAGQNHSNITRREERREAENSLLKELNKVRFPWVYHVPYYDYNTTVTAATIAATKLDDPAYAGISYSHINDHNLRSINEGRSLYVYRGISNDSKELEQGAWILLPPPVRHGQPPESGGPVVSKLVVPPWQQSQLQLLQQLQKLEEDVPAVQLEKWAQTAAKKEIGCVNTLLGPEPGTEHNFDVVLFHGLQPFGFKNAFIDTWQCKANNKVICSLAACIHAAFPGARVLSVSYDSSAVSSPLLDCFGLSKGNLDWPKTRKLLAGNLELALQAAGGIKPTVFIGHSLGGLVMQQVVLEFSDRAGGPAPAALDAGILQNIRGIVYYATPHGGSHIADWIKALRPLSFGVFRQGRMMGYLNTLSEKGTAPSKQYHDKRTGGPPAFSSPALRLYELQPLVPPGKVIVPEESALQHERKDLGDTSQAINTDHVAVCKPTGLRDPIFLYLFIYLVDMLKRARV